MPPSRVQRVHVIDSHSGGEPTRVVVSGGPDLGRQPLDQQRARFASHYDSFRTTIINEPRGSEAIVGALLCQPVDGRCVTGVIFFNDAGYLHMCGHGTMGVMVTLAYLGRIGPGKHFIETPVGVICVNLLEDGAVAIENVSSFRLVKELCLDVPGYGPVTGDVAWGGNWFFITGHCPHPLELTHLDELTAYTPAIRSALSQEVVNGHPGSSIDHIEVTGPAKSSAASGRNFVLCPGRAYDRSPCGTGTSAKLACLYADGLLKEGEVWRQEGILGTVFEGSVRAADGMVIPTIKGKAWVCADSTLLYDSSDPFKEGIPAPKLT